jgi:hypothetical protein
VTTRPTTTTVRTPHTGALADALTARDYGYQLIAPDRIQVQGVEPDDLGWIGASAGVVIYEMTTRNDHRGLGHMHTDNPDGSVPDPDDG